LFAIPATGLSLLARRNRWLATRALVVAGFTAAAGVGVFTAVYGRQFLDQIFFYPREFLVERVWDSLGRLGNAFPALLVWYIWESADRGNEALGFPTTFVDFLLIEMCFVW
jgi:hypothetical protein